GIAGFRDERNADRVVGPAIAADLREPVHRGELPVHSASVPGSQGRYEPRKHEAAIVPDGVGDAGNASTADVAERSDAARAFGAGGRGGARADRAGAGGGVPGDHVGGLRRAAGSGGAALGGAGTADFDGAAWRPGVGSGS